MAVTFSLNGERRSFDVDPETPLLYVLRNDAELNGAKFGCGLAQCGACTVNVDGTAVPSCVTPVGEVADAEVLTIEGLGTVGNLHPLQQAFIDEQAAQCGYCIAGMVMSAHALLSQNASPSDDEIHQALVGNLCRCGTHTHIREAVRRAAEEMAG
jgi:nicotinate dehydrogenase subunit A